MGSCDTVGVATHFLDDGQRFLRLLEFGGQQPRQVIAGHEVIGQDFDDLGEMIS